MKTCLILFARLYRLLISPLLHFLAGPGAGCRFEPTCSRYFEQAVREHGAFRGIWLGLKRLLRCHPWGPHGYDPVPPAHHRRRTTTSIQPTSRP